MNNEAPRSSPADVEASPAPAPSEKPVEADGDWQPRLWSKVIILLLVIGYLLAFVASNDDKVEIDFLVATVDISLLWLILGAFAGGLVSGVLLSQLSRNRRARALAAKKNAAKNAD